MITKIYNMYLPCSSGITACNKGVQQLTCGGKSSSCFSTKSLILSCFVSNFLLLVDKLPDLSFALKIKMVKLKKKKKEKRKNNNYY